MHYWIAVCFLAAATLLAPAPCRAADGNGDLAVARQLQRAFEKVAEEVSPAVVVINCTYAAGDEDGSAKELLERFFNESPTPDRPERRKLPRGHPPIFDQAEGSGLILRADGYILTNFHVVEDADKITVRIKDERKFTAQVIGADDRTDLAVIKVNAKGLPAARLGDSDTTRVGQWAIAIGAPFQLDYSFTVGFVSAKGRSGLLTRGSTAYEDYIQTDAAINPGNSGGPLVNIESEVIGINTLIRGLRTNIGFAIPINMAKKVADQIIAHGRVIRPWLGIQIESLSESEDLREYLRGPTQGVVVRAVEPNGPAAKSPLRQADIITAVAGHPVRNTKELQQQVLNTHIGDVVDVEVFRNGKTLKFKCATGEMPGETRVDSTGRSGPQAVASKNFGITVADITPTLAEKFALRAAQGVVIIRIEEDSVAEQKDLRPGDVITEVERKAIKTQKDFAAALAQADRKRGVMIYYSRRGKTGFTVLKEAGQ